MNDVATFRGFHSAVADVACSLESLHRMCSDSDFAAALGPSLTLLRLSLDRADKFAGPDGIATPEAPL